MGLDQKTKKRYLLFFWIIFFLPFFCLTFIFLLITTNNMGFMPSFKELENPKSNLASEVLSEDGKVLGVFFYQNRSMIDFDNLSPYMISAIVAIEDIRFEKHSGIDTRGLGRVLIKTLLLGNKDAGGGSTLTQQLAKNLFGRDTTVVENALVRKIHLGIVKFKEWVTAVRLERNYTKKEILVMYLNTVFFGSNSYGIKAASKTFLSSTPDSLKIEEAALLAGIINAPTRYSPLINPKKARLRRNIVLMQMQRYNFISKYEYDSLSKLPLRLKLSISDHNEGQAAYMREYIRRMMTAEVPSRKNYYDYYSYKRDSTDWETNPLYGWIKKHIKPDGSHYDLYSDGLKIHTTINSKMQIFAEESLTDHLGNYLQEEFYKEKKASRNGPFSSDLDVEQVQNIMNSSMRRSDRFRSMKRAGISDEVIYKSFRKKVHMRIFSWRGERDTIMSPYDSIRYYKYLLRAGFMSMDPHTGYIKAYVGGPSFRYFKYDHVLVSRRQVGSTIKPFLYTVAMQEGYSPCYKVPNVPQTFIIGDTIWSPKNAGETGREGELVTLKWGLANSVNYISAWLIKQFSEGAVIDIMRKMGVTSDLLPVPSIILGTPEISLYEMTGAYSTFANKGVYITPTFVTKIEDRSGTVLSRFYPQKKEAISEKTSALMINLLEAVITEGTGLRLRGNRFNMDNQIAGKTGTTQNQSDGWFMGITPNLVSGVWVGGEDRSVHFNNLSIGQGANMALPIWALYMEKVYANGDLAISQLDTFDIASNLNVSVNCKNSGESIIKENYDDTNIEKY